MKFIALLVISVMFSTVLLSGSPDAFALTIRSWTNQDNGDLANGGNTAALRTDLLNRGHTIPVGVAPGSLSAGTLAGVDVFFHGKHSSLVLTASEETALNNFVQAGGCVIIETNSNSGQQTSSNSLFNALGLGSPVGATGVPANGGTFDNIVTKATVGPVGDLRGLPFAASLARDINPAGGTLFGTDNTGTRTWVEFTVGAGSVMGTGDPYSQSTFFDSQPNNRNAYINFIENCKVNGGQVIGGEIIPIETTSLILAGAQTFSWMIPVLLSGIGIGLFVVSRNSLKLT